MSRQSLMPGASSKIDAEISRVQNEIKALDRSIAAQQQQRNALSTNLDALLAAKEKSDMLASSFPLLRIQAAYYTAIFLNASVILHSNNAFSPHS
jgi:septal ring factor EnvC (AmiA/AmiB activator)